MRKVALVCAGGFCGTLARYVLMAPLLGLAGSLFPTRPGGFPYDIFIINLSGAFALGLLYGLVERGAAISPDVRLAVGTGFLGAYTTFSTFVYGGDKLLASGFVLPGALYLCGSVALGVLFAWIGALAAATIVMRGQLLRRGLVHVRRIERCLTRSAAGIASPQAKQDAQKRPAETHLRQSTHAHQRHQDSGRHNRLEGQHVTDGRNDQWSSHSAGEHVVPQIDREEEEISR